MKSRKWVNLSLIFLLALLVIFQTTSAAAHSRSNPENLNIKIKPGAISQAEAEGLYDKAQGLAEKFADNLKSQSGDWYHWTALISDNTGIPMIYPDGTPLPSQTIHETWYTLNQQGTTENGFYLVKSLDGKILQQVLYRNNIAYNLTFQDILPFELSVNQDEDQPYFDFNFIKELRNSIDNNRYSRIESNAISADKALALRFSIMREYEKPFDINGFPAPVQSCAIHVIFNVETGGSYQIEKVFELTDGKVLTTSIAVTLLEKLVTLPDDVQALVDQPIQ